jgi:hypothetical protein
VHPWELAVAPRLGVAGGRAAGSSSPWPLHGSGRPLPVSALLVAGRPHPHGRTMGAARLSDGLPAAAPTAVGRSTMLLSGAVTMGSPVNATPRTLVPRGEGAARARFTRGRGRRRDLATRSGPGQISSTGISSELGAGGGISRLGMVGIGWEDGKRQGRWRRGMG